MKFSKNALLRGSPKEAAEMQQFPEHEYKGVVGVGERVKAAKFQE